jgi:putative ABC transport system ATP-binding protein
MAEEILRVENLTRTYHIGSYSVHALRGVSFTIKRGELVAIMGASGSGKSTLMNILGCLDQPDSGQYVLDGIHTSRMSRDERAEVRNKKIGFVFQSFNLLPRATALENVELPLVYNGAAGPDRHRRSHEALKTVGLSDRASHLPNQLSGGQQQRVAIARALVNRPVLLLADEPTGNLDSRTSIDIMELFQDLNRGGVTVVLITHEHDIAAFAGRVMTLKDGRLIRDSTQTPRSAALVAAEMGDIEPESEEA